MANKKPTAPGFLDKARHAAQAAARTGARGTRAFKNSLNPERGPALRKAAYYASYCFGWVFKLILTGLALVVCTVSVITMYGTLYLANGIDAGAPLLLSEYDPLLATEFYAKTSADGDYELVETISSGENLIWASYAEIPQYLKDAIVAIEDKRFWDHEGVDWKRTLSAFTNMFLQMRGNFGGSTITQQLIKNITGENEATVQRKFQEIFSAMDLENIHSKEYILENYLNVIPLGNLCKGVKTAAAEYFGKELSELTLLECACLAGITNNPYLYDPYQNPKNNRRRTEYILWEMYDQEKITEAEYTRAMSQKLVFTSREKAQESKVRTWYVDEAIRDLTHDLMRQNGWGDTTLATQVVFSGGLSVYLAQDLSIQKILDDAWYDDANWPKARDAELPQGSMMISDPYTGDIVAMVGSRTKKTANLIQNMATQSYRQPGSAIKPISVYSPAFELGYLTPYSAMLDAPVDLNGKAYPLNLPRRYDGRVTVQYAVEQSKNTVAVRIMRFLLTPEISRQFAEERFHLSKLVHTVTESGKIDGESSMALGGLTYGASVKEMTAAYSVFPTGGTYCKPRTYTHAEDKDGAILIDNRPQREAVITPITAYYINTALKGVVASGTATRAKLGDIPTAGKTGTTNDNYDRWFCGYSPYYVGVCWYGYEMPRDLGDIQPNPAMILWIAAMTRVHEGLPLRDFDIPAGLITAEYCVDSGMLPTDGCRLDTGTRGSRISIGHYGPGDAPTRNCTMHLRAEMCGISGHLARPECPAATRKTVYLIRDPDRIMYSPGVAIGDEQYTYRQYNIPQYQLDDPSGQYFPARGDGYFNTFCGAAHPALPPSVVPPVTPVTPEQPEPAGAA